MKLILITLLILVGCVGGQTVDNNPITLGADSVNEINTRSTLFTARRYPYFEGIPSTKLYMFLAAEKNSTFYPFASRQKRQVENIGDGQETSVTTVIPTSFDISVQWPQCKKVFEAIQDQSMCTASWAVAPASMLSDRRCIRYNGTAGARISAWDLLTCAQPNQNVVGNGCEGGYTLGAVFGLSTVPTGGPYGGGGCVPYQLAPGLTAPPSDTPCIQTCQPSYTKHVWRSDDFKSIHSLGYIQLNNTAVQNEVLKRGSVVAQFKVYQDFYQYSSGIYQHTTGELVGSHAVKIHGWGEENGVKYWKVANSWGPSWGEGGLFRIIRDVNECGFEEFVIWAKALKD